MIKYNFIIRIINININDLNLFNLFICFIHTFPDRSYEMTIVMN